MKEFFIDRDRKELAVREDGVVYLFTAESFGKAQPVYFLEHMKDHYVGFPWEKEMPPEYMPIEATGEFGALMFSLEVH